MMCFFHLLDLSHLQLAGPLQSFTTDSDSNQILTSIATTVQFRIGRLFACSLGVKVFMS